MQERCLLHLSCSRVMLFTPMHYLGDVGHMKRQRNLVLVGHQAIVEKTPANISLSLSLTLTLTLNSMSSRSSHRVRVHSA